MLDWGVDLPSLCSSIQGIFVQVGGGRSASRSAKFGAAVFKTSMFEWGVHLPVDLPSLV